MRKFLLIAISAMLLPVLAIAPAMAAVHRKPPTLPAVTQVEYNSIASSSTSDSIVFILVTSGTCGADCSHEEVALAGIAASRLGGARFVKADAADLNIPGASVPMLMGYVRGVGRTFSIENFHPSSGDLKQVISRHMKFAVKEMLDALKLSEFGDAFHAITDSYDEQLKHLKQTSDAAITGIDNEQARVTEQKLEELKPLTAALTQLTTARQAAVNSLPAQAPIDAQLRDLQKKINDVTTRLDGQLAEIAARKQAAIQQAAHEQAALITERDRESQPVNEQIRQTRQDLFYLMAVEKATAESEKSTAEAAKAAADSAKHK